MSRNHNGCPGCNQILNDLIEATKQLTVVADSLVVSARNEDREFLALLEKSQSAKRRCEEIRAALAAHRAGH